MHSNHNALLPALCTEEASDEKLKVNKLGALVCRCVLCRAKSCMLFLWHLHLLAIALFPGSVLFLMFRHEMVTRTAKFIRNCIYINH